MRPTNLTVENFLPLSGKHTLDLSQTTAATISGPNESGKSSLMIDSLLFALFGKARKRPEGLINNSSDEASVTLDFNHHGSLYSVKRQIKRGKPQTLHLYHNNKDISERLLSNTQKKLEDILGFSYNLLLSTAVAQQDEINMLSIMGPTDREKILNEMIGNEQWEVKKKKIAGILNDYKDLSKNLQEKETELIIVNQEIEKNQEDSKFINEKVLVPLKTAFSLHELVLGKLEDDFQRWQENQKLINKRDGLEGMIKLLEKQVKEIPKHPGIEEEIKDLEGKIKENDDLTKEANVYIESLYKIDNKLHEEVKEIQHLISLEPSTTILKDVPCVGMDIHDTCKLLSNALQNKNKIDIYLKDYIDEDLRVILKRKENELIEITKKIKEVDEVVRKMGSESNDFVVDINNLKHILEKINEGTEKIHRLAELIEEVNKIEVIDLPKFDNDEYQKQRKSVEESRKEIQINEIKLNTALTNIVNLEKNKEKIETTLNSLRETESNLANYKTLQMAYNEIPTLLFEEAMPLIEQYANEILEKISPERTIQLRSFKETKSNTVQKALDVVSIQSSGAMDFDDLSGSAKFRQSLALRIALARYNRERHNTEIDMFIVDEGFGSLDSDNVFVMKSMLKEIAQHFDLFLMISHLDELKDVFDTQIIINTPGKGERISCLN